MLKKWKRCGAVQASCGCLVIGHVCTDVRISVFAPQLCNNAVLDLNEYADGCRIQEGAERLFCLVGALEGGFRGWVVPQGCPPQKVNVPSTHTKRRLLTCAWIYMCAVLAKITLTFSSVYIRLARTVYIHIHHT
jgi:hypothetical protein